MDTTKAAWITVQRTLTRVSLRWRRKARGLLKEIPSAAAADADLSERQRKAARRVAVPMDLDELFASRVNALLSPAKRRRVGSSPRSAAHDPRAPAMPGPTRALSARR
jgi:hypothetical protein